MPTILNCGYGKIVDIYFRQNILFALSDTGMVFYFYPDESKQFTQVNLVDENISCVSMNQQGTEVYLGFKSGKLFCF